MNQNKTNEANKRSSEREQQAPLADLEPKGEVRGGTKLPPPTTPIIAPPPPKK